LSIALLLGYGRHAITTARPLLRLGLFRIRTFRTAVAGSFITRLGIGGMPFLLPLLYQVGLGFTPIQSGLLIMPQFLAAMGLKTAMPRILTRFGYRRVLLGNTVAIGLLIALFSTIGPGTPVAVIALFAFCFGFAASLQYSSMNTLAYADVADDQASMASTIASAMQQMSMSFGVATASLVAGIFVPERFHADPAETIRGIHAALLILGGLTVFSAIVFRRLSNSDGAMISQHKIGLPTA
jgi:MFS family permease